MVSKAFKPLQPPALPLNIDNTSETKIVTTSKCSEATNETITEENNTLDRASPSAEIIDEVAIITEEEPEDKAVTMDSIITSTML